MELTVQLMSVEAGRSHVTAGTRSALAGSPLSFAKEVLNCGNRVTMDILSNHKGEMS